MTSSDLFWNTLRRVDAAGAPRTAARIANLICRDRRFSLDQDGDRVNRQADVTFVSPDLAPSRYAYIKGQIVENWLFQYQPTRDDVVLDIGAGIGEEAVVLGRMARRVVSVEAHPRTFRCLQKTIRQSGIDNVTAVQCAIAREDGELRIEDSGYHLANAVGGSGGIPVPARSIASLCAELGIDRVDFMKMNIEGAEADAVLGFGNIDIRHMVISCHDFLGDPAMRTMAIVSERLREQGFSITTRPDHPLSYTRCNVYAAKAS